MKKILFLVILFLPFQAGSSRKARNINDFDVKNAEWEVFVKALTWVESRHDPNAKNHNSSALGLFQQLKMYVDDVNRIEGKKRFSYADRKNPKKAREMFEIYQSHYNPNKDISKAINIHRGKRSEGYRKAVYKEINDIKSNWRMK